MTPNTQPLAGPVRMTTLAEIIDLFVIANAPPASTLAHLFFWRDALGEWPAESITTEQVDAAIDTLVRRGRLKPRRGREAEQSARQLRPATINRYLSAIGGIYRFAKRQRLIKKSHPSPTVGIERLPEPTDPDRYLRAEQVERIIAVARTVDKSWQRLPALIRVAFTTGLRKGNLQALRWRDVDLDAGRITIAKTKNGRPHVAPLVPSAIDELGALPGSRHPDDLVFGSTRGKPFNFRGLWARSCDLAGYPGRNFHQLRHGCGSALARAGVSQAQIMGVLGHRTLSASARYVHLSVKDRADVVERVFA